MKVDKVLDSLLTVLKLERVHSKVGGPKLMNLKVMSGPMLNLVYVVIIYFYNLKELDGFFITREQVNSCQLYLKDMIVELL